MELNEFASELTATSLRSSAGLHNLTRWEVKAEYGSDRIVALHEATHDHWLRETPYGYLQLIVKQLERSRVEEVAATARQWTSALLAGSTEVHESAATYMSIKTLPLELQKDVLLKHPPAYQRYYSRISDIVDHVFGSTFLQYLVASRLLEMSLAPLWLEGLKIHDPAVSLFAPERELPDGRFAVLCSHLTPSMLMRLLENAREFVRLRASQLGIPQRFEVTSEDAWLSLTGDQARTLESHLIDLIRHVLFDEAERVIGCIRVMKWGACARQLRVNLSRIDPALQFPRFMDEIGENSRVAGGRSAKVLSAGRSVLRGKRSDLSRLTFEACGSDPMQIIQGPQGPRALITESFKTTADQEVRWIMGVQHQGSLAIRGVLHSDVLRFVAVEKQIAQLGAPIPEVPLIVGVHSSHLDSFKVLYSALALHFVVGNAMIAPQRLIWYLGGDYFAWIDYLTELTDLEVLLMYPASDEQFSVDAGTNPEHETWRIRKPPIPSIGDPLGKFFRYLAVQPEGLHCFSIRGLGLVGQFIRWFPTTTSYDIAEGLAGIPPLPVDYHALFGKVAISTLPYIGNLWEEF